MSIRKVMQRHGINTFTGRPNLTLGWEISGTQVTATAAELNALDGITATVSELNVLDGITSTVTELNLLDGVTATTSELNYVDVATAGTVEASKAVVVDASKDIAGYNVLSAAEYQLATIPVLKVQDTTIATADVKTLNATPVTVIDAPGANKTILLHYAHIWLDYATTAYDGIHADEDLQILYTNGSGGAISGAIECTGFLDQAADEHRVVGGRVHAFSTGSYEPVANAVGVLAMATGEIATGDSPLKVRCVYQVVDLTQA